MSRPAKQALHIAVCTAWKTDRLYQILDICGPFDGGCLLVGMALQRLLGGRLCAIRKEPGGRDHHIVVELTDQEISGLSYPHYLDAAGLRDEYQMIQYLKKWEFDLRPHNLVIEPTSWHHAAQSCSWDCWVDQHKVIDRLIDHFGSYLGEAGLLKRAPD